MSGIGMLKLISCSLLTCCLLCFDKSSAACDPKKFECTNGKCTDISNVCDGYNHCGDNSDEKVCDPFQCHPSTFQCLNGKCIPRNWVCGGSDNCDDNSDEQVCEPFHCHPSAFQCSNGKCISRSLFCKNGDDCGDNSDERYCSIGTNDVCPQGWTKCSNSPKCVPTHWICDEYPDCYFAAEEKNCEPFECHPSAFQCSNGKCITRAYVCNGADNCGDNSDEQYCNKGNKGLCSEGWTKCANNQSCVPSQWMCDRYPDCSDGSDEINCVPFQCHPSAFQCTNGRCISRSSFCNGADNCGDNSDEGYCNIGTNGFCPEGWSECPTTRRCLPSQWMCDGYPDCPEQSDEKNCVKTPLTNDYSEVKSELKSYLLSRRKPGSSMNRWGSQVHRIAVALHLADNTTFAPGNSTGDEIRYELMMQLLFRIPRNKMSSQELAMYIHALMVSCVDPQDLYGGDMVRELRRMVEATGNYTNPFLILVLCNAGDTMTSKDVDRMKKAYNSQHRPVWTDSQALSSMALSCIASRNTDLVDERILTVFLQELKKRQFRNGTVDNFRSTALVSQALFIHDSYKRYFDMDAAIRVLVDSLNERKSILNTYYALPVLHGKSLLNVSSSHCVKQQVAEDKEASKKSLDVYGETIIVQYSIWMGDDIHLGKTWRLRVLLNSTIYDVIESVAKIENNQNVQYDVVNGKPYVTALNDEEDDPELGTFWFIYLKAIESDEKPSIVEQSPVDLNVTPNHEIILWYKLAPWNFQTSHQKQVTSK